MHLIRKAIVLAFAGLGMYKAWEIASPKFADYRQRATKAKDRIEPALHETEDAVHAAADDVKAKVNDLSHTVTDTITDAVADAPAPEAPRSTAKAG